MPSNRNRGQGSSWTVAAAEEEKEISEKNYILLQIFFVEYNTKHEKLVKEILSFLFEWITEIRSAKFYMSIDHKRTYTFDVRHYL